MPGLTPSLVRRIAAGVVLCLSVYATRPPHDSLLAAMFTAPMAFAVTWVAIQLLGALSRGRTPNPAINPLQTEETIVQLATLIPVVVQLGYCVAEPSEALRLWRWLVLGGLTAWRLPSPHAQRSAVRRGVVALLGGIDAAAYLGLEGYMASLEVGSVARVLRSFSAQEWTCWALASTWA